MAIVFPFLRRGDGGQAAISCRTLLPRGTTSRLAGPPRNRSPRGPRLPGSTDAHRVSPGGAVRAVAHSRGSVSTVGPVKIQQIAPALHGAKMQTAEGTYPVVVWAVVQNDDGSDDVVGLAVGPKGSRTLIGPDPGTFESYSQTG